MPRTIHHTADYKKFCYQAEHVRQFVNSAGGSREKVLIAHASKHLQKFADLERMTEAVYVMTAACDSASLIQGGRMIEHRHKPEM